MKILRKLFSLPIFKNVFANSLTMVIILFFQLISVPVFLKFWGVERYGEWIVLNTLTAYFQMTDVGLNTATGNSFTFHFVRNEKERCNILINNNILFILVAFLLIFLLLISLMANNFFLHLFNFKLISEKEINLGLILLFAQVFIGTLNNLLNTFYIASKNYARGIMIDNLIRASEYMTLIIGIISNVPVIFILTIILLVKFFGLIIKYIDSNKFWKLQLGFRYFNIEEFKAILLPAVSFFSFPIANSIIFQGITLLVNFMLGSVMVVMVNTTRTLVNFCKSITDIIHKSVWPELSLAFGLKDYALMRNLHRRTIFISLLISIFVSIILFFFASPIYLYWTKHKAVFMPGFFNLLLVSLVINILWSSSNVLLQATNNHKMFSLIYLFCSAGALVLAFIIIKLTNKVNLLPIAFIASDIVLFAYVFKVVLKITNDTLLNFWSCILEDVIHFSSIFRLRKS